MLACICVLALFNQAMTQREFLGLITKQTLNCTTSVDLEILLQLYNTDVRERKVAVLFFVAVSVYY